MEFRRRDFAKLALTAVPATALFQRSLLGATAVQAKPNSKFAGVQIGTITYSYRNMPDQSAEATLKYLVESGISACELMGGPVDAWAREKSGFQPSAGRAAGGGAARAGGGAGAAAVGAAAPAAAARASTGSWNGQPCPATSGAGTVISAAAAPARGAAPAVPAGGGGGGRAAAQTPEQIAAAEEQRKWRQGLSMQIFKDLKALYNNAGVTIYAVKNLSVNGTDEDLDYQFSVAKTLGASHITAELPTGPTAAATLKRVGDMALKHGMYAAYHTHAQGGMTAFDEAFAASKGNRSNVDLGHFVAGGNKGGTPIDFLNKFHDKIASFHLKDRTLPEHCGLNLPWGTGETPIKEILRLVRDKKWDLPASIEQEYAIPAGSDAVIEVRKCVQYGKDALLS